MTDYKAILDQIRERIRLLKHSNNYVENYIILTTFILNIINDIEEEGGSL